jgi:CubicO group peptidase (beta-lactamase class C family)
MSGLENLFLFKLGDEWNDATEGFCIQSFHRGKKIVDIEIGKTYHYYDWASLTKIVFTTTALMRALDEKKYSLRDRVSNWIEWFPHEHPAKIKDLMAHDAGMHWWHPFYKKLNTRTSIDDSPEEAWSLFQDVLRSQVLRDIKKNGVQVSKIKSVYSDLDFFLLGAALGAIEGQTLYATWSKLKDRMGLDDTDFNRGNKPLHARKFYAPTENDPLRGGTLQGEVHDENTWALKGVAPHAGLFGSIGDLSHFGLLLRKAMRGEKNSAFPSPATVKKFTTRSIPRSRGDWGLGFVMPSKEKSTAGPLFSMKSVGHTGFTGTSIWYDPVKDLLVTILSNRVHPSRKNTKFQTLRPLLHTWIAEEL